MNLLQNPFLLKIENKMNQIILPALLILIDETLGDILSHENDYSTQCQNFYTNWLEKARNKEHFI